MMQPTYITPSDTNFLIKQALETNEIFNDLWITGEISNLKYYAKSHMYYFSLSDKDSQINCVLFGNFLPNISFKLENGLNVLCRGKISVFHKRGTYSYQVAFMSQVGVGDKARLFQKLKNKLTKEGLFDSSKKMKIPTYVTHVGIITAYPSAAAADVIKQFNQLAPHIKLTFIPTVVQGKKAVSSIINSLNMITDETTFDCVFLMRGGGSSEDLDCFNEEKVIRKLADCSIPLITAIGHESDSSLADYVSDHRCSTPTEAAILVSSPYILFQENLNYQLNTGLENLRSKTQSLKEKTTELIHKCSRNINFKQTLNKDRYLSLMKHLESANPLNKFTQGFSICSKENGEKVTDLSDINKNDIVKTQLINGVITSKVNHVEKKHTILN
jgi:exodeoxyribonuclease VII large subunit